LNKKLFIRIGDLVKEVCLDCNDLENIEEFIINYINDNLELFKGEKGDDGLDGLDGEKGDKGDDGEIDINELIFEYQSKFYSLNDLFFKTIELEKEFKEFAKKCASKCTEIKCYPRVIVKSTPIKIDKFEDRLCYKIEYQNCYCYLRDRISIDNLIAFGWCPVVSGELKSECWFYRIGRYGRRYYTSFKRGYTGRFNQYTELEWHQRFTGNKKRILELGGIAALNAADRNK
jgi:hypothetical protein